MSRSGWTLFELIVVLCLLGVIAAGAALTVRSPLRAGRLRGDRTQMLSIDRRARSEARRFQRELTMQFEWDQQPKVVVTRQHNPSGSRPLSWRIESLEEVRQVGESASSHSLSVKVAPNGTTPTYAFRLFCEGAAPSWVVIAGQTGQVTEGVSDHELEDLFHVLQSAAR